tara:strand:- start:12668 stop:13357 length:690 start_codon:yes stop_codon:yes gene_type:complete
MSDRVKAVSVMWTEIPEEVEHDLNEWYDREHVKNRVDVPGYVWGKRYKAVQGGPAYMAVYATESPHVQAGDDFLEVVQNPTPGETEFAPHFYNTIRMMCDVTASVGDSEGGFAGFLTLTPMEGAEEKLRGFVADTALPALLEHHGIMAAHLWERNPETTAMASRGFPGDNLPKSMMAPDWMLAFEGTSLEGVIAAKNELLPESVLRGHGAEPDLLFAAMHLTYRYEHRD